MGIEAQKTASVQAGPQITFMDRMHARMGGLGAKVTGFVYQPEPRRVGSFARGKQMAAGNFRIGGHLLRQPDTSIWDLDLPAPKFAHELHGFAWLDDLAAAGGSPCRKLAQASVIEWIDRFGDGKSAGWSPDQTGRRLIRWINHALFLMNGQSSEKNAIYFRSLGKQASYLSRRWHVATPGLPRFEALTGLLYAGISLNGVEHLVEPAAKALARECKTQIDDTGGLPSRNPEELLDVFTLLDWAHEALKGAERTPSTAHSKALERITFTLQSLRHADGGLARFHGGGRGADGRLDEVVSRKPEGKAPTGLAMGFARLSGGDSSVIVDAASLPKGAMSRDAHASTLAFELTCQRQPLIVNCGSGRSFGADWRRAGRATPSHSSLCVTGVSSARLTTSEQGELLTAGPKTVKIDRELTTDGPRLVASHDAYRGTYGLIHSRELKLRRDGLKLAGEDNFDASTSGDKATFEHFMNESGFAGVPFAVRFHLHPDIYPSLDMGGTAVSLTLKDGAVWVFRNKGAEEMALKPSVYLEKGRLKPRPTQQIVLSSRVMEYGARVSWVLAKAKSA